MGVAQVVADLADGVERHSVHRRALIVAHGRNAAPGPHRGHDLLVQDRGVDEPVDSTGNCVAEPVGNSLTASHEHIRSSDSTSALSAGEVSATTRKPRALASWTV